VAPQRVTDSNPWLAGVEMGRQEIVRYEARDGLEIEGVLIRPLAMHHGDPPPLMLVVHGGPEAHYRNGWMSYYSRPGQVAAARGYAVFYPNYRSSTGRGVEFSKMGQSDAAGPEFDDLVDGVEHLADEGIVDGDRVGVTGGSYGGYATAWLSTRYTDHFQAGVMFVGISNKMTKALTTEIPIEDRDVHTLTDPWKKFEFSLERSPISYVEQARTPLLISGGTADSRVHPSQSLQLYRALKLRDKSPVRYVRYPGEGHGNRDMAARQDYARRLMRWMDHFVVGDAKTLPPWSLER
jgi:dipeptidyl aminopeptidase/acylaminoacyl peptidase